MVFSVPANFHVGANAPFKGLKLRPEEVKERSEQYSVEIAQMLQYFTPGKRGPDDHNIKGMA